MLDEMKCTLDIAIVNKRRDGDSQPAWLKEQVLDQFETEWTNKRVQFEEFSDRTKLLNDSIEYIHQKYSTQEAYVEEYFASNDLGIGRIGQQNIHRTRWQLS